MEDTVIYEIRENVVKINATLEKIVENTDLKFEMQEEKIKVANKRIMDLENSNQWLWRTCGSAIIVALISLIFKFK